MHIDTHYYTYHNPWGLSQFCTCQSHGSPSAAQSSSTRPFLGRRLCTFCPSHPSSRSCGWLPVVRARDRGTISFGCRSGCSDGAHRYNHVRTSTALTRAGGLGRLPHVLRKFLGAGLVPGSLKLYEVLCDLLLFTMTHDVLKFLRYQLQQIMPVVARNYAVGTRFAYFESQHTPFSSSCNSSRGCRYVYVLPAQILVEAKKAVYTNEARPFSDAVVI